MDKEKLKKSVYYYFSDKVMIILAIVAIPIIVAEYFYSPASIQFLLLYSLDWIIWIVFVVEFALKLYVENSKIAYIKQNKLDSAISIIIILSPLAGLYESYYVALPALRLLRITKVINAARATRIARAGAYTGNTAQKSKPKPRQETFIVTRVELRQILVARGVADKSVGTLIATLEKTHRHTNIIVFANLLEKMGIDRDKMANIFRRIGMDDVIITNAFRMVDESKISAETGRLYDAQLELQ